MDPHHVVITTQQEKRLLLQESMLHVRLNAHDTGGAYALIECVTQPGAGVAPHLHTEEDETLFVLSGELEVTIHDRCIRLNAGEMVLLPRQTIHSFRVIGNEPGKALLVFMPAGVELYFEEMSRLLAQESTTLQEILSLSAEYGIRFVRPVL